MAIIRRFPEIGTGVTMPAKKSATKSSKAKKAATRKSAAARKTAARKSAVKAKTRAKAKAKATARSKPVASRAAAKARTPAKSRAKPKTTKKAKAKAPARSKARPAPKARSVAKAKVTASKTSAKPARPRKAAIARKPAAKTAAKPVRKAPAKTTAARRAESKGPARARAKASRAPRAVAMPKQRRVEDAVAEDDEGYDAESPHNLLLGPRNVRPYVERRGEAYMSTEQLDHFRLILTSWKRDLMEEVDRTMTHMKDEAANPPDPNDRATLESEFALELRTRDRERKLIRKIDEALKRIDDGSYGYCLETGEPIGVKRLEARPVATLCIEAQERRERREKQYGDRDDWYR
jgi:DnaK suppressor protein